MDRNMEFNGYSPFENMNFDPNMNNSDFYKDSMFNPIMQYEQAYMYYRYLTQQLDYKIKCKEYEKMCNSSNTRERRVE